MIRHNSPNQSMLNLCSIVTWLQRRRRKSRLRRSTFPVPYTNRPFKHQRRHRKRLIIVATYTCKALIIVADAVHCMSTSMNSLMCLNVQTDEYRPVKKQLHNVRIAISISQHEVLTEDCI